MAKLMSVFRPEVKTDLQIRHSPLMIDDETMIVNRDPVNDIFNTGVWNFVQIKWVSDRKFSSEMVMDLKDVDLFNTCERVDNKELEDFKTKYLSLEKNELFEAFRVDVKDVLNIVSESIPCVGCRRSVERLYFQIMDVGKLALDPLLIDDDSKLIIRNTTILCLEAISRLLNGHADRLNRLVENQPRSKKSKRCLLHSWDLQKSRLVTPAWKEVWAVMDDKCKGEITMIDFAQLLGKLDNYLKKHKFCVECRTKVMKAYNYMVEDKDPSKEKGFNAKWYMGIRRCIPGKHIHLPTNKPYIDSLIARAEPELMGTRRDRHAKTMEIAQEEVLTCLGMCVYDRIHRVYLRLREEEFTCQVLAAAGVEAMARAFETFVDKKRGVTSLELLCLEIRKEEIAKVQKKELKKLKKKKKKGRAKIDGRDSCDCESEDFMDLHDEGNVCEYLKVKPPIDSDRQKLQILDRKSKGQVKCECDDCREKQTRRKEGDDKCASCDVRRTPDCGYISSGANSSPESSEVACSEGLCDHDGKSSSEPPLLPGLTLADMLLSDDDEEEAGESLIPQEDIQAFHAVYRQVDEDRLLLRDNLKKKFAQLCIRAQTT